MNYKQLCDSLFTLLMQDSQNTADAAARARIEAAARQASLEEVERAFGKPAEVDRPAIRYPKRGTRKRRANKFQKAIEAKSKRNPGRPANKK